ncbi:MAG: hypothetical protein JO293_07585 [Candidatus Eremiobacteraeota bacterium]|nr:hypothetical protein [Candidatus Eremiobacteraeota bacterium]
MKTNIIAGLTGLALAALAALPSAVLADSAHSLTGTYATSLTQTGVLASPGTFDGSLRLRVAPDGVVSGWYTPADSGQPLSVTGGLRDGSLWLDIGDRGELHVNASVTDSGKLVGTATELTGRVTLDGLSGPATFDFVADPTPAN